MADEATSVISQAVALMREGKVQEADDLLSSHSASLSTEATATGGPPTPAPPRTVDAVILDLFRAIARRFGNHPEIVALLNELEALAVTAKL